MTMTLGSHLSSGVDDFRCIFLALVFDDFAKGVLDCWVVALNEMPVDELYGEGGFA